MSFGFYRVGSQIDPARAFQRYAKALAADSIKYGVREPLQSKLGGETTTAALPPSLDEGAFSPGRMTAEGARAQGYTGNTCSHCGGVRMQVAGHCEVCSDCGTTTGCS